MHYNEYIYNISHLNAKFKKLINNSRNTYLLLNYSMNYFKITEKKEIKDK